MKTILKFALMIICLGVVLSSCRAVTAKVLNKDINDKCLYLISGFDDAAENTDVLFTLGFDKAEKKVFVAQIPRDTYFNFGEGQNKINQFYASLRAKGLDSISAMQKTSDELAGLFGTHFDGFVGLTTDAFRAVVDALGGIDLELKSDVELDFDDDAPIILKSGVNHIYGEIAEKLVRFRSGYVRGDLARIDVQKLFLNAMFTRLTDGMTLPKLISVVNAVKDKVVTNLDLFEIADLVFSNLDMNKGSESLYVTLPGEAIQDKNGLSYYVINRKSGTEITQRYMFSTNEFDREFRLLKEDDAGFANIYEDDSIRPMEYNSENISKIHIK
jgi:LCP family protein required for cell wall assembly